MSATNWKLVIYRDRLGLTQEQMAELLGIGQGTYNRKEKGKSQFTQPEINEVMKIVRQSFPDATVDEIFFNSELSNLPT